MHDTNQGRQCKVQGRRRVLQYRNQGRIENRNSSEKSAILDRVRYAKIHVHECMSDIVLKIRLIYERQQLIRDDVYLLSGPILID